MTATPTSTPPDRRETREKTRAIRQADRAARKAWAMTPEGREARSKRYMLYAAGLSGVAATITALVNLLVIMF